jgi:hypothetical protein
LISKTPTSLKWELVSDMDLFLNLTSHLAHLGRSRTSATRRRAITKPVPKALVEMDPHLNLQMEVLLEETEEAAVPLVEMVEAIMVLHLLKVHPHKGNLLLPNLTAILP